MSNFFKIFRYHLPVKNNTHTLGRYLHLSPTYSIICSYTITLSLLPYISLTLIFYLSLTQSLSPSLTCSSNQTNKQTNISLSHTQTYVSIDKLDRNMSSRNSSLQTMIDRFISRTCCQSRLEQECLNHRIPLT